MTRYRVTRVTEVIIDTADHPNDGCVDEELAEAIARALPEGEWNVVGVEAERDARMKRNTLRWPFPEGLAHRPDIFPCQCAPCRDRRMARRIGDFDGRPAPIHGPDVEIGDEFDTHGAGGAYREGWVFPGDSDIKRKGRLR